MPASERGELTASYKMNQVSLRINRLKFKTSGELLVMLEAIYGIHLELVRVISTWNQLDLETLGFRPIMAQKFARTLMHA